MEPYESPIDRAIREATERGEFDDLPGAGKPLPMRNSGDPDWWLKQLVEREQISPDLTVSLRREADGFPESLLDLPTEDAVRAVLDDFNERVKADWMLPRTGRSSPIVARRSTSRRWCSSGASCDVAAPDATDSSDASAPRCGVPWLREGIHMGGTSGTVSTAGSGGGGAVYGLGLIGALVWYWQQADGFWMHLWAFVEAILWPAFVVYDLLQHMS